MKLHIPSQTEPVKAAFPNHPRKIKKWLAQLPRASMGDMTRQIYNALVDLNRQQMPAKYRIENMELFLEPIELILHHLHKHFINRSLPLPDKSLKIINLNQALLREITHGYKIIIFDVANGIDKLDDKNIILAAHRAITNTSLLVLRASQIYASVPRGSWWDVNHIYQYICTKNWQKKSVPGKTKESAAVSLEQAYKKLVLFSLSRPHALRHSETERVFKQLDDWNDLVNLTAIPLDTVQDRCFSIQIKADSPPACISTAEHQNDTNFVAVNTEALVNKIRSLSSDKSKGYDTISTNDGLTQETLRTLATSWSICAKRRFSRNHKNGGISASIGLTPIYNAMYSELNPVTEPPTLPTLSLEAINTDYSYDKEDHYDHSLITHPNLNASMKNLPNAWDIVASGNVLTDTFIGELKAREKESYHLIKEEDDLYWEVINISAGGYCLHWNSDTTSKAQVGELIGIREKEPDHSYHWRAGIIRWMQYTQGSGLDIGVQVLSPKVIIATVERIGTDYQDPFECLMLPGIKPINQPSTLLLPAHAFKIGTLLKIHVYERTINIKLSHVAEHTGSFTQFQFTQVDEKTAAGSKKQLKKEAVKPAAKQQDHNSEDGDDFDSIWSSL
ncbi:MAG: hypothetical protein OEY29_09440 [Gammaproteobacteria bacterium]|nr:hypothetical protein [Gammaproteobacteria bacterium]